jgi:hypothetical protein
MKHLIYLLTVLTLSLSIISCDKDRNFTIIEGTVLEYETLDPIENAAIEIYQTYSKGLFQGFVQWPIDTIYTNANGSFKFRTDIDPHNAEYNTSGAFGISQVWHENYFSENSIYGEIAEVFHLDKVNEEIQLDPYAWLQFHLVDVPEINSDFCKVGGDTFEPVIISNGQDSILNPILVHGNKSLNIYKKYTENGDPETDSVYINAFDTLLFKIIY